MLRIFFALKIRRLRPGLNPQTWVLKASTLPLDHRSRYKLIWQQKLTNQEYNALLVVRYWRHPAELAIIHEVENVTIYTTEVYTNGSNNGDNVGAAGIIFVNGKLVHQLKFKPHGHCSNYQAEQITILKVLEN